MKKNKIYVDLIQTEAKYHFNPTLIFNTICNKKKNVLLLESAENESKNSLESMIIIDCAIRICCFRNIVELQAKTKNGEKILHLLDLYISFNVNIHIARKKMILILTFPIINANNVYLDEEKKLINLSVFESLRCMINFIHSNINSERSVFFGGLFSYDLITNFEPVIRVNKQSNCPDFCFYLAEMLLLLDHRKKNCLIQSSIFTDDKIEIKRIQTRHVEIKKILNNTFFPKITRCTLNNITVKVNKTDQKYREQIHRMKNLIQLGEIFQIVLSRKFYLPCINSLAAYDELKKSNPSPYMFFMQDQNFTLFGASPESSLKYDFKNKNVEIHPIAGTRSRGKNKDGSINLDLDSKIELEMRMDKKELSEHLMLVDLARNDLAKICETGTRYVENLMKVEKYSHVMHLVSKVIGKIKEKIDIFHAYQSCMNMGTLTGAPKIRAMQIIAEEQEDRGVYGGAIGYFTGLQKLDTCIIIRSAYVVNNIATIQAGAGIVFDSIANEEILESKNKAQAVLIAIAHAHNYRGKI
ncbi:Anthranilate synthase component 1 (plasmid) [Buchnera aphidicola (Eriosoma lanigerum)]|uniref:anthranilate synthase component 1 n=1 Tax=Buchnera aphidicola TaxID=9 RepID=UPI00346485B6